MHKVSSSDGSECEGVCKPSCKNIFHDDYKSILGNFSRFHTVNYNCSNCFNKFLCLVIELAVKVCDSFSKEELLSENFVIVNKSIYNDLIEDFIVCKNEHQNHPPNFFLYIL